MYTYIHFIIKVNVDIKSDWYSLVIFLHESHAASLTNYLINIEEKKQKH